MKYHKKNTKKRLTINNASSIIIFALLKVCNFIINYEFGEILKRPKRRPC